MNKMIFEPIEINGMKLKNRIGLAPLLNMPDVWTTFSITDATIEWFEARARGGAGLIMTGSFIPMMVNAPGFKERFAKLAEAIHAHGAKLGVQITGEGSVMMGTGPSTPPYPDDHDPKQSIFEIITFKSEVELPIPPTPVAFTIEETRQHIQNLITAAATLKDAEVDCVELHCAHGGATLCCSYISPFYNKRTDEYGGSWEKRLRLPVETIRGIREAVGENYPILVRISADELLGERGITLKDTTGIIVPALEEAGVDCFDVSQGSIVHSPEGIEIPLYYPRGCYIHNAEAVKRVTRLPVIGVGRIVDLDMAEQFLQEGKADIVYMGRQLTADPETPKKYFEGRSDEIRRCIGCVEGCGTPCPINYDIAPGSIPITEAKDKKRILIIGGGIAGMEAARVCALRGHQVTLIEKSPELGGTVAVLALEPLNAEFGNFVEYLRVQMKKLKIEVKTGSEAGVADVEKLKPDALILATGASLTIPEMAEGKPGVMDHIEALRNRSKIGKRVVIWGLVFGAELALSLAAEGKEVTLIGGGGEKALASHASNFRRWWIVRKMTDVNVVRAGPETKRVGNPQMLYNIKVEDISSDGISIVDMDNKKSVLTYDTLIISRGRRKNDSLFGELEGRVKEVYRIGDCSAARNIEKAVWSANEVARKI
jgi:2,4-dienoyl-CoA reductase-like NADH-dependent reductase (Old Yellow Enzyme family)/thioredoxin reductase